MTRLLLLLLGLSTLTARANMTFPKYQADFRAVLPNRAPTTPKPVTTTQREFTGIAFPPQVFEILTGGEPSSQNLGGRKNISTSVTNGIEGTNMTNVPELLNGATRPPSRVPPSNKPAMRPQAGSIAAAPQRPVEMPDNRVGNASNVEKQGRFRFAKLAVRGVHQYLQSTLLSGTGGGKWDPLSTNMLVSPLSLTLTYAQMLMASGPRSKIALRPVLQVFPRTDPHEEVRHELNFHKQLGSMILSMQRTDTTPVWTARNSQPYVLESNTAIFVQTGLQIRPTFIHGVEDIYRGRISLVDYSNNPYRSVESINSWASIVSRGKIANFLSAPPSPNTAALFASCVYFKAPWRTTFNPELTGPDDFYVNNKEKITANYIRGEICNGTKFLDSSTLGIQAIKLAYNETDDVALYMFMAKNSSTPIRELAKRLLKSSGSSLAQRLNVENPVKNFQDPLPPSWEAHKLATASATLHTRAETPESVWLLDDVIQMMSQRCAIVQIPKLVLRGSLKLSPPGGNGKDQLAGLLEDPNRALGATSSDTIIHETFLEITETGTEAAAISAGSVDYIGGINVFKANRPFLILIRHEPTQMPLFWGAVVKPKTELLPNNGERFNRQGKK